MFCPQEFFRTRLCSIIRKAKALRHAGILFSVIVYWPPIFVYKANCSVVANYLEIYLVNCAFSFDQLNCFPLSVCCTHTFIHTMHISLYNCIPMSIHVFHSLIKVCVNCFCGHPGFYLGILFGGEAISPQVNTITTTVQSQEYTGREAWSFFGGSFPPAPPLYRTLITLSMKRNASESHLCTSFIITYFILVDTFPCS